MRQFCVDIAPIKRRRNIDAKLAHSGSLGIFSRVRKKEGRQKKISPAEKAADEKKAIFRFYNFLFKVEKSDRKNNRWINSFNVRQYFFALTIRPFPIESNRKKNIRTFFTHVVLDVWLASTEEEHPAGLVVTVLQGEET